MTEYGLKKEDISNIIIGNAPVGYACHKIICDESGSPCDYEYVDMNSAFEEYTGMCAADCIGKRVTELLPDIREGDFDWIAVYGDIALNNTRREFDQYSHQLKRWYHIKAFSPEKYYFVTYIFDISKDKAQMLVLEQFSDMVQDLLGIAHLNGRFIRINEVWEQVLGYSKNQIGKLSYLDLVYPEDRELTARQLEMLEENHGMLSFTNRYRCKDGSYKHLDWRIKRFDNLLYATARDISEKIEDMNMMKRMVDYAEELLRQSSEPVDYQQILDNMQYISKAKYAVLNLYTGENLRYRTVAVAGHSVALEKAAELLGFRLVGKEWENDPSWEADLGSDATLRFAALHEVGKKAVPRPLMMGMERLFGTGEVYMIKIHQDNIRIGDFVLILSPGETLKNKEQAELYARQVGIMVTRLWAEAKLKQSERLLSQSQRAAHLGSFELDLKDNNWQATPMVYEICGFEQGCNYSKQDLLERVHLDYIEGLTKHFEDALENGHCLDYECKILRMGNEKECWVHILGEFTQDARGNPEKLIGTMQDITNRKQAEEEVQYLSYHDKLTGLYNRRFFDEQLIKLDKPEQLPISIIMGDANGLKMVNDFFGHEKGDELLKKAAQTISGACRRDDIVVRLGGDEFVVLLPKTPPAAVDRIVRAIQSQYQNATIGAVDISVSFGWDTKTKPEEDILRVLKNAEDLMYQNKYAEQKGNRNNLIKTIINTLHQKNPAEEMHANRVSKLSGKLAKASGCTRSEVDSIALAGLFHDIGKIAIDQEILNKQGPLTEQEEAEMRRHPEIGYRILSSSYDMAEIGKSILAHHEWWDGTGYPNGLKGEEEIPLVARIIAIADSYDTLTTDRYREKVLSEYEAAAEIKNCAGSQFDPELARLFVEKVLGKQWNECS